MFSFISSSNRRTKDGICSTSERRTGMSRPDKYEMQREFFLSNNVSKVDADLMRDSLWMTFIHGL